MALAALSLMALPSLAQKYTVTGQAPKDASFVYLQNRQERTPDSVAVKNGTFTFTGEAEGKIFATVYANPEKYANRADRGTYVLLDGNVTVDLAAHKASGDEENERLSVWAARFAPLNETFNQLLREYYGYAQKGEQAPADFMSRLDSINDVVTTERIGLVKQCVAENSNYRFPAIFVRDVAYDMDKAEFIAMVENGSPAFMQTSIMDRIKASIAGWKRQLPGTQFTDIQLPDTNGKMRKLSDYVGKGKYVLIDFWASWCGPCRREMPNVKKLYAAYKSKGFDIVGLSLDQDKAAWLAAIKKLDLPWHHLSDLKYWDSLAASTYGINSIPATLLIGPDGKVIASGLDAEGVAKKLDELLK